MYTIKAEQQQTIIHLLVEGNSIRSVERLTGVHRDTIMRLMVKVGNKCRDFLDAKLRGLKLRHIQCDEIWTFVGKKQSKIEADIIRDPSIGDQYLYVAFDTDTKLIATYATGKRTSEITAAFIDDLAGRIVSEYPQLSTDGFAPYVATIKESFGEEAAHGVLIKDYAKREYDQPGRYGPPPMIGSHRTQVRGLKDIDLKTICTSHVERNNLTIRTFIKRFARLSLGFSKKLENLAAAVALHVAYYNFCRVHGSLGVTPAMEAGLVGEAWELADLLVAIE
ncbi:MAG TPA: IS1 family transposase [Tepidisphaeraceae bacterium]|jgi:IS1 family transposase